MGNQSIFLGVLLAASTAACGWLPPDAPQQPTAPGDPDIAALVHDWTVSNHVLGDRATISDGDAAALHGRHVVITATGYTSPWEGSCDDAGRQHKTRALADVTTELEVSTAARTTIRGFGLGDEVTEYRVSCTRNHRATPLTMFVTGKVAMTCWSGVCYLLTR